MRASCLACFVCILTGCTGAIDAPQGPGAGARAAGGIAGGGGGSASDEGLNRSDPSGAAAPQPSFRCDPNAEPPVSVLLRLTQGQYLNTLRDLLGRVFTPTQVESLLTTSPALEAVAALPRDGTSAKELVYDTQDQRFSTLLIEPQVELASAIATWISADATRLNAFVRYFAGAEACATPSSERCVSAFIAGFGLRALRRPLDDADQDAQFYRATYDQAELKGYNGLIASFLMAPGFLFRTEFKGSPIDARDDFTQLSPFEQAARLSYYLTNSMPDEALLAAAGNRFVAAGSTLEDHAVRLLQTPRARAQLRSFYRQWLREGRIPDFNPSVTGLLPLSYPGAAATALPANLDLNALRTHAFDEMVDLLDYYTFGAPDGRLADALTSQLSFARTPDLAQIYGVAPWAGPRSDGSYDQSKLVELPEGQRAGLFTRAGFLFSGYADTNPMIRGARIRVEYLCDDMKAPANINPPKEAQPPQVPTVRHQVEAKTSIAGTPCAGCHTASINPLGFPFEIYDALGRYRTQEPLYDAQRRITEWVAVDARTEPNIDRNGDTSAVDDALGLSQLLADSARLNACFVRNFFRYFAARAESQADGCVLTQLQEALVDPSVGSLVGMVQRVPRAPEFSQRRFVRE